VKTARCPIAVACVPEEFAAWLERNRIAQQPQPARAPAGPPKESLSCEEIGRRAAAFASQLARCLPDERHVHGSQNRFHEAPQETESDVGT